MSDNTAATPPSPLAGSGTPPASALPESSSAAQPAAAAPPQKESLKDTFESIAVALILAFVFRAFIVEAFVIPTGSMASTLMGRHYEIICDRCGFGPWPVGMPREEEYLLGQSHFRAQQPAPVCPNCNHVLKPPATPPIPAGTEAASAIAAAGFDERTAMPHSGDRILVLKYLYEFASPRRWDVVVFRFPGKPKENYIKRLVGLPGEYIMILDGDVYVSTEGAKWQIARKLHDAPRAQDALWNVVHAADFPPVDGDYFAPTVHIVKRWETADPAWQGLETPVFRFSSSDNAVHTAVYRQFRNQRFNPGGAALDVSPRGPDAAISDMHEYNGTSNDNQDLSRRVVSDLRLTCDVAWTAGAGFFQATLTKLYHQFTARVHADGRVELFHTRTAPRTGATTAIEAGRLPDVSGNIGALPPGRPTTVELVNVDYVVQLKVNGAVIGALVYNPPVADGTGRAADPIDLLTTPMDRVFDRAYWPKVELAGANATFDVRHVRIDRDIYYSQLEANATGIEGPSGGGRGTRNRPVMLSNGKAPGSTREYFVLGDNSNASSDSRFWIDTYAGGHDNSTGPGRTPKYQLGTVPEEYLTGKAFFVYWPSGYSPGNHPWLGWLGVPRAAQWRLIR